METETKSGTTGEPVSAENAILTIIYCILFTNDIVCGIAIAAASKLRNSPLYRQRIKQTVKRLEKNVLTYERNINRIARERSFFLADANDVVSEEIQEDLKRMEIAIKQEFDRCRLKNSGLMAKLELLRCMAEFACISLDKRIEEGTPYNPQVKNIDYLRMTDVRSAAEELTDVFYKQEAYHPDILPCNLTGNENCKRCMAVISRKLTDCHIIEKAIRESDAMNSEH